MRGVDLNLILVLILELQQCVVHICQTLAHEPNMAHSAIIF